ncbi:PfkB family carbohydrate kinase [Spiroplasma tabanidicola]|uniref:Fructokinase n=1 Tax=Spiroplasma tabanidicola TaxID=324079 RepID=A0A6I6CD25_9MOLU|nr:PfkB family carbohydrate kinase [Spiroplasma tabanidicola]QGS52032.1 fructokinase [Spiroplasma tabanidicola]
MNVICIGEALMDVFIEGDKKTSKIGGAPLNAAIAIKYNSDKNVYLGSNFGDDENSNVIRNFLKDQNINNEFITTIKNTELSTAVVSLEPSGERNFKFDIKNDMRNNININIDKIDLAHFGSAFGLLSDCYPNYIDIMKKLYETNKIVVFDPNYRDDLWTSEDEFAKVVFSVIKYAKIVKLSEEEFMILNKHKKLFFMNYSNQFILMTKGENGVEFFHDGKGDNFSVIKSNKVVDTTGAGDGFIGALISQLSINFSYEDMGNAIKFANKFAKRIVEGKGALCYL